MTSVEQETLDIDKFIFLYTNTLLHLYDDVQFKHSPFFMSNLRSGDLTTFLIDCIFYNNDEIKVNPLLSRTLKRHTPLNLKHFLKMYRSEILDSFSSIKTFLTQFKCQLKLDVWSDFCFLYSDLSELYE